MISKLKHSRRERRGVAIVYAVFGAFVAASMVAVMLTAASVTHTESELKTEKLQASYLAEGAIEAAKVQVKTAIANWSDPPASGEVDVDGVTVPYEITSMGINVTRTDAAGIQTLVQPFEITATARVGDAQVVANRIVDAEATPIFQFAVFYSDDLEINPGPSMTLGGRVHSNEDMYLGCGATLTMDTNYVRSVGGIYRRRKDSDLSKGTVEIRRWVQNPYAGGEPVEFVDMNSRGQMTDLGIDTVSGYDSNFVDGYDADGDGDFYGPDDWLPFVAGALELWGEPDGYAHEGNTVMTGEHGQESLHPPDINSIAAFDEVDGGSWEWSERAGEYINVGAGNGTHERGYFHDNAGLSIMVSPDGSTYTAYDASGIEVTSWISGAVTLDTIYDARQGGDVPVILIDMADLGDSGYFPDNGLIYASHYDMGEGTQAGGVQLTNGSELYRVDGSGNHIASALTVVTEGSVYIQGDYNTTNKRGAAVIGDGVNLLSNAWDGSKEAGDLPDADDTTYNVAMITGNHSTEGRQYSGGLENLPRFHESWSNKNCVIRGSFVCPWESEKATGLWAYGGDRYKAPRRLWSYDKYFNRVSNLPPFTPMVVTVSDVVSW